MRKSKNISGHKMTIGLQDIFLYGDMTGCIVKEAINHNPTFVQKHHSHHYILDWPATQYMVKKLYFKK